MKVLSFDPGGTTGYCYQDENAIYEMGDAEPTLIDFLRSWNLTDKPVDYVVVEGYRQLPKDVEMSYYAKPVTQENIGRIKGWAELMGLPIHEYLPKDKPTQCKATQVFPKKKPKWLEHRLDAYNHGRYFLIKKGLAKTALELEMGL